MITFFWDHPFSAGDQVRLAGDPAQHARARRVQVGDPARILNGRGTIAEGRIHSLGRAEITVAISALAELSPPPSLEVIVPVADRDRMLFAAEKCAELQVAGWRPAYFARSRSVSPRGEGEKFRAKVDARMRAALEQSGGAWLPRTYAELEIADLLAAMPAASRRIILDSSGTSIAEHISNESTVLAIGPEGGYEPGELQLARSHGWRVASLGPTILRFETAIIAAVATVRALQHSSREPSHGQ